MERLLQSVRDCWLAGYRVVDILTGLVNEGWSYEEVREAAEEFERLEQKMKEVEKT